MSVQVLHGDNRQVMAGMPDASIDAIVTDPPYELGFMGKKWDASGIAYQVDLWRECLRVLKPGGHLLAFGGTRTYHRMAVAIEDAGFEIRDSIHWVYGSGFPKSLDVSKAIDKAAGAEREVIGTRKLTGTARIVGGQGNATAGRSNEAYAEAEMRDTLHITAPATDVAKQWQGWGTALKPAHEPIVLARKPLDGTVAGNVLQHGTGGLNIDECRVGTEQVMTRQVHTDKSMHHNYGEGAKSNGVVTTHSGRWPANVVFDKIAGEALDQQSGVSKSGAAGKKASSGFVNGYDGQYDVPYGDSGGASRFFTQADWSDDDWPFIYQAKPSKKERNAGLENNNHPTVKPVALMRHLIRLVTPPNGTVLDPFAGSGTTLVAAIHENKNAIGIELQDEYLPIIQGRIKHAEETKAKQPEQANLGFDQ